MISSTTNAFLETCHEGMSKNYNNSEHVSEFFEPHRGLDKHEAREEWVSYLVHKFRYFALLENRGDDADQEILQILDSANKSHLGRFIPAWKAGAQNEEVVYLYRILQLPDDLVHRHWYSLNIEECERWCKAQERKLREIEADANKHGWTNTLETLYADMGKEPRADLRTEIQLSMISMLSMQGLKQKVHEFRSSLAKSDKSYDETEAALTKSSNVILKEFQHYFARTEVNHYDNEAGTYVYLIQLALVLTESLYREEFDETKIIAQYIERIRKLFPCEVVDYLEANNDNALLEWLVGTIDQSELSEDYRSLSKEELKRQVQQRESYARGVGITGSILLLEKDNQRNLWHHIGSNDVRNDPRQSKDHVNAYESDMHGILKVTKKIENFWAFPVYKNGRLHGAFRVVNSLLTENTLQPGGWPYHLRVRLAAAASLLSEFLTVADPQLERKDDFTTIFERNGQINVMVNNLGLRWIRKGVLAAILRHLTRDIGKKREKRHMGCCILIVKDIEGRKLLQDLPNYPLIQTSYKGILPPYDKLDSYHDAVNPSRGAFLFDHEGNFLRIVELRHNNKTEYDAIQSITQSNSDSLCLLLSRNSKSIKGYRSGDIAVEIYISEGSGEWFFRYPKAVLETMVKSAPTVEREILRVVCDACLEMSNQALGGLFVIGNIPDIDLLDIAKTELEIQRDEYKIQRLGKDLLIEFAKLDGATFIQDNGVIYQFNSTIQASPPRPSETSDSPHQNSSDPFRNKGARHKAGLTVSRIVPNVLVVIVSENRGITLVSRGERIAGPL